MRLTGHSLAQHLQCWIEISIFVPSICNHLKIWVNSTWMGKKFQFFCLIFIKRYAVLFSYPGGNLAIDFFNWSKSLWFQGQMTQFRMKRKCEVISSGIEFHTKHMVRRLAQTTLGKTSIKTNFYFLRIRVARWIRHKLWHGDILLPKEMCAEPWNSFRCIISLVFALPFQWNLTVFAYLCLHAVNDSFLLIFSPLSENVHLVRFTTEPDCWFWFYGVYS